MSVILKSKSLVNWLCNDLWEIVFLAFYVDTTGTKLVERHTNADERLQCHRLRLTCKLFNAGFLRQHFRPVCI